MLVVVFVVLLLLEDVGTGMRDIRGSQTENKQPQEDDLKSFNNLTVYFDCSCSRSRVKESVDRTFEEESMDRGRRSFMYRS